MINVLFQGSPYHRIDISNVTEILIFTEIIQHMNKMPLILAISAHWSYVWNMMLILSNTALLFLRVLFYADSIKCSLIIEGVDIEDLPEEQLDGFFNAVDEKFIGSLGKIDYMLIFKIIKLK